MAAGKAGRQAGNAARRVRRAEQEAAAREDRALLHVFRERARSDEGRCASCGRVQGCNCHSGRMLSVDVIRWLFKPMSTFHDNPQADWRTNLDWCDVAMDACEARVRLVVRRYGLPERLVDDAMDAFAFTPGSEWHRACAAASVLDERL